jgi:hypothetical protein
LVQETHQIPELCVPRGEDEVGSGGAEPRRSASRKRAGGAGEVSCSGGGVRSQGGGGRRSQGEAASERQRVEPERSCLCLAAAGGGRG